MHLNYDTIIIGGGVIGLACAAILSKTKTVLLLERHGTFGQETSSRNSQVIHAGMYYPDESIKAQLCAVGNRSIYLWCVQHSVPFKNCGKYIIGTSIDHKEKLNQLHRQGFRNGVIGMKMVTRDKLRKTEPNVEGLFALYSGRTGIVDSHKLMQSFLTEAESNGTDIAWKNKVIGARKLNNGYELTILGSDNQASKVTGETIINSAGLEADAIAAMIGASGIQEYQIDYYKGNYFKLAKKNITKSLIYPLPLQHSNTLGIHLVLELDGTCKLGPDMVKMKSKKQDYTVDPMLRDKFYQEAKLYLPNLDINDLTPDMSGIRPLLRGEGFRDFVIKEDKSGWINLIGIASPGLTCSIEIANLCKKMLDS